MTAANASPNVDVAFAYQVARPTGGTPSRAGRVASNVTSAKSPSGIGVVRAMARSLHWSCVSTPKWRRTSASSHHAPA
jgi:hypothetical protein